MKRVMACLIFLILCVSVQAAMLSDYPYLFVSQRKFDAIYVIGEEAPALDVVSATVLSTALARYPNITVTVGNSRIDSEVPNIVYRNAIVIGSPCENQAAAILEGNPTPCFANLSGGIGYIKLFEQNNRTQLLITGLEEEDRHAAAKFLATAALHNILSKEFQVASGSGSSIPAKYAKLNLTNAAVSNITNVTVVKNQTKLVNVTKTKKEKIGEYEPLARLPERKGWFSRFIDWLLSFFR